VYGILSNRDTPDEVEDERSVNHTRERSAGESNERISEIKSFRNVRVKLTESIPLISHGSVETRGDRFILHRRSRRSPVELFARRFASFDESLLGNFGFRRGGEGELPNKFPKYISAGTLN